MLGKRGLIVALVGINLILLAALVFSIDGGAAAYANPGGRPGDFALCTVKVHKDWDVLYVLDQQTRRLHCLMPTKTGDGKLTYVQSRDLEADVKRSQP
jgi:hypothetical protein